MISEKEILEIQAKELFGNNFEDFKKPIYLFKNSIDSLNNGNKFHSLAEEISSLLEDNEKVDLKKAKELSKKYNLTDINEITQECELAVVMSARKIAENGESTRVQFERIIDLYDNQPTIQTKDGRSRFLQQFSTPAPIAFLASKFVSNSKSEKQYYLEPSAGNGMLTIALDKDFTFTNDIDEIRYKNLKRQNFIVSQNVDAKKIIVKGQFKGVITNPPFLNLKKEDFLKRKGKKGNNEITYTFKTLDHKLAILALESMSDDGRAAIIVGGKLGSKIYNFKDAYFKNDRIYGEWNVFISYLNRQYNIDDIVYISGDLYAKQGTTYPIVMILIDGRKSFNSDPNYIWRKYDPVLDKPIGSFTEYFNRVFPHIHKNELQNDEIERKKKLLILAQAKIKIAKAKAIKK